MSDAVTQPSASGIPEPRNKVLLLGNPNVGKSVLFGALTGKYATVSNYPGTTVEIACGQTRIGGRSVTVIDTPGIHSLIPMSEDERVARDMILEGDFDFVIQVADAKNLDRALPITLGLAELGVPTVLCLNMMDEALARGHHINTRVLEEQLGVPVVGTVAIRREGLPELRSAFDRARPSTWKKRYSGTVEHAVTDIEALLPESPKRRGLAVMLLSGDESLLPWLEKHLSTEQIDAIAAHQRNLTTRLHRPPSFILTRERHAASAALIELCLVRKERRTLGAWAQTFGNAAMHPVWGVPVLLGVLYLLWLFVGNLGAGFLVDLLENHLFGEWVVPAAVWLFSFVPWEWVRDFFVGDFGLISMGLSYSIAIVLPIVGTFFLAFGLLEDSGYLSRLAIMANRLFRFIGLNGKAVLPMVLGLGCDTMATLTTRILETRRERLLSMLLLVLAVPCSAQLGVILAMMEGVPVAGLAVWLGAVVGVFFVVGWAAARVIPGTTSDFVLEVPPIRLPQFRNIAVKTLGRIEWYLKEAVPLFLLGTSLLWLLDRLHLLEVLRRVSEPVVTGWLGLPVETADAFVLGFLRRDFGAAGLFMLQKKGMLSPDQIVVCMVTITLFVPCVANFFMVIKERNLKSALLMSAFVVPFAFFIGGLTRVFLAVTGLLS